jgi:hypothetical protein
VCALLFFLPSHLFLLTYLLTGRGLISLICIPTALPPPDSRSFDPALALRIDAVHHLQVHAVNHRTLAPAPGATALFRPRLIHRSTKVDAEVMDAQVHAVLRPANELPWARPPKAGREGKELFEVYRHCEPQVGPGLEPKKAKAKSVVAGGYVSVPCFFFRQLTDGTVRTLGCSA